MKDRIALQFALAQRVATVGDMAFSGALFNYTQFWYWFNMGHPTSTRNPVWREYMAGLAKTADPIGYTAQCIAQRPAPTPPDDPRFGYFSYSHWSQRTIRIHFTVRHPVSESVLSRAKMPARLGELKALFGHVKRHRPHAQTVQGGSWLYNIPAYRRLFPPTYLATARETRDDWRYMGLWGQFIDHRGAVKINMARRFLACIAKQTELDAVLDCFPYQVLQPKARIDVFYEFYGIG